MNDYEFFIGKSFKNHEEAELFVSDFCKRNFHPVNIKQLSIESYNKKVCDEKKLPESVKYYMLNWKCKHFGVFKSRGKEKRQIKRVFAMGCKFEITITYSRVFKKFAIIKANLDHQNHDISSEIYQMYPEHRKPNAERQLEVDKLLLAHASPTFVANLLHLEGSQIRIKDLYNRKQKLIKSQGSTYESVNRILLQPEVIYRIITNNVNEFEVLFLQTIKQQELFSNFKEVVQMVTTYKTNNYRYALYTLLIEDNYGIGQPIAFGIVVNEDQVHIEKFLKIFSDLNDVNGIHCFIIDKDITEINAINICFPNIHINICYFHIMKAVDKYLSNLNDKNNKVSCLNQFKLILQSKTLNEFDESVAAIKSLSSEFYNYVIQTWLPFKKYITPFFNQNIMHLHNRTNNRTEQFHKTLKQNLGSVRLSLDGLIKNLLKIVNIRPLESLHHQFDMSMKTPIIIQPNIIEYYNNFTEYAANLISNELIKLNNTHFSIKKNNNKWTVNENSQTSHLVEEKKCSCGMPTQLGLPCRHLLAVWILNKEPLVQLDAVASRWRKISSASVALASQSENVIKTNYSIKNEERVQKYNNIMAIFTDLASLIADQPTSRFSFTMKAIESLRKLIMSSDSNILHLTKNNDSHLLLNQTQIKNEESSSVINQSTVHYSTLNEPVIFKETLKPRFIIKRKVLNNIEENIFSKRFKKNDIN